MTDASSAVASAVYGAVRSWRFGSSLGVDLYDDGLLHDLNRPADTALTVREIVRRIASFRSGYRGRVSIQIMITPQTLRNIDRFIPWLAMIAAESQFMVVAVTCRFPAASYRELRNHRSDAADPSRIRWGGLRRREIS